LEKQQRLDELDCRQFLRMALMSSAMLLLSSDPLEACGPHHRERLGGCTAQRVRPSPTICQRDNELNRFGWPWMGKSVPKINF